MESSDPRTRVQCTAIEMKLHSPHLKSTKNKVICSFGVLTTITSLLAIVSWTYQVDGIIRVLANAAYILALPGWVLVYALGFSGVRDQPMGIVAANFIAWFIWFATVILILSLRSRFIKGAHRSKETEQIETGRRAFLANAACGVVGVGAVSSPVYATLVEPWTIRVRRYTIAIKNLHPNLVGLKLVQLADTHLGPRIPESFVQQAVYLVIKQNPDLVLLTGDHIHDGMDQIARAAELCRPLVDSAKIGVLGVLGNHDWWGDGPKMSQALEQQGVWMIDNDRVWIDPVDRVLIKSPPVNTEALTIVGLGDLTDGVIDHIRAFRDVENESPTIVLAHNPDTAELNSLTHDDAPRIDLMCSGHTHGGQVRIPLMGTPMVPSMYGSKYAGGLVQGPAFPVHISRGIGMSMLPVRVGVPPEISVITIVSD